MPVRKIPVSTSSAGSGQDSDCPSEYGLLKSPLQLFSCLGAGGKTQSTTEIDANTGSSALKTTTVIQINSAAFAVHHWRDYDLELTDSPVLDVITSFPSRKAPATREELQTVYHAFLQEDYVFCTDFLKHILLLSDDSSLSRSVLDLLASWGCKAVFVVPSSHKILPGPYFFSRNGLFSAWRLYADDKGTFVLSTIPSQRDPGTYENLNAAAFGSSSVCVAVPSRLKFSRSPELPLAGLRVAVKDLFHLKGIHTGCGNRAYRSLHDVSKISSPILELIMDRGATIVGKTKTVEFGGSQEVIGDWSDYFYSFNMRADGYLASTGSSTGSASGLAAYPWLDITIGTDGGGSVRDPAVAHGIYGLRPSHDGTETSDVVIPCGIFHTTGFLGRSS